MKLSVASPCKRDWARMKGDDAVRFCGDCKMNVYNLSALTEQQLDALVKENEGRVCGRFFTRPDGTVLTRDCPVGVSRKRKTYAVSFAAVLSLIAAPFVMRPEACDADGSPGLSLRDLVYELKVKLGILEPAPVMGKIMRTPIAPE